MGLVSLNLDISQMWEEIVKCWNFTKKKKEKIINKHNENIF